MHESNDLLEYVRATTDAQVAHGCYKEKEDLARMKRMLQSAGGEA